MGFESLGGAAVDLLGGLFGGGGGGGGGGPTGLTTQIVTAPRPTDQLAGAHEPLLAQAAGGMLGAALPFAPYGAGYQLVPQALMGQVHVPGPNQTMIGNPFNQPALENFFGTSAPAPQQPIPQSMFGSPPGGLYPYPSPALNALFQMAQNSNNMVGNRPSNQGVL